jgi:hypothetical protein
MPTLGTAGKNRNFTAAFTVPSGQTLHGYVPDNYSAATPKYSALDVAVFVPSAKAAGVKAALAASSALYSLIPRKQAGYAGATDFSGFRIRWRNGSKTAAQITTLLAAVNTALA